MWRSRGAQAVYCSPQHNRGGFLRAPRHQRVRSDCWIYRHTLFVTWEGRVLACCHDLTGRIAFGNLKYDSMLQIRREKAERIEQSLSGLLCRRCDFPLADRPAAHQRIGGAEVEAERNLQ